MQLVRSFEYPYYRTQTIKTDNLSISKLMSIKFITLINEQSWYFYLTLILFTVISFSAESCTNSNKQNQLEQNPSPVATAVANVNVLIDYLK